MHWRTGKPSRRWRTSLGYSPVDVLWVPQSEASCPDSDSVSRQLKFFNVRDFLLRLLFFRSLSLVTYSSMDLSADRSRTAVPKGQKSQSWASSLLAPKLPRGDLALGLGDLRLPQTMRSYASLGMDGPKQSEPQNEHKQWTPPHI